MTFPNGPIIIGPATVHREELQAVQSVDYFQTDTSRRAILSTEILDRPCLIDTVLA